LDELLTNAMLFVPPSDLEGLSVALLDAMGAGVCVLASDIPENRELVDGSGFTFRHGDRNDLERRLRLLISEPEIRKSAASHTGETVWEHYLWSRVARDIEVSYLTLAAGNNVLKPASPAPATARALRSTTDHVGTAALGCPAEQCSAIFMSVKDGRAKLD
jgi:hypothetical protein